MVKEKINKALSKLAFAAARRGNKGGDTETEWNSRRCCAAAYNCLAVVMLTTQSDKPDLVSKFLLNDKKKELFPAIVDCSKTHHFQAI